MSSVSARRTELLAEVERAKAAGAGFNDWMGLALRLAEALPAAARAKCTTVDLAAWADYKPPLFRQKGHGKGDYHVTFADGKVIWVTSPIHTDKPYNWGRAARVATEFWRSRSVRHLGRMPWEQKRLAESVLKVPKITAMECNGVALPKAVLEANL